MEYLNRGTIQCIPVHPGETKIWIQTNHRYSPMLLQADWGGAQERADSKLGQNGLWPVTAKDLYSNRVQLILSNFCILGITSPPNILVCFLFDTRGAPKVSRKACTHVAIPKQKMWQTDKPKNSIQQSSCPHVDAHILAKYRTKHKNARVVQIIAWNLRI